MNCLDIINDKLAYLKDVGIETSKLEMRILMEYVLQLNHHESFSMYQELTPQQINTFSQLVDMRALHMPIDKIVGYKGFYKYDFEVSNDVLSPRPDTEILVESAIKLLQQNSYAQILEFGVGSGCIILSLLAEIKDAKGWGIDISNEALKITNNNSKKLNVDSRLNLINASWFDDNIISSINNAFDIIVSNPPYIKSDEIQFLDKEVKDFDPLIALDGGNDGLRDYIRIAELAYVLLKKDGFLLFEIGENQLSDVINIAKNNKLTLVDVVKDLSGTDRCIILKK